MPPAVPGLLERKQFARRQLRERVAAGGFSGLGFQAGQKAVLDLYTSILRQIFGLSQQEAENIAVSEFPGIFAPGELEAGLSQVPAAQQPATTPPGDPTPIPRPLGEPTPGTTTGPSARPVASFRIDQNEPIVFDPQQRARAFREEPERAFNAVLGEANLPRQGAEIFRRRAGDFLSQFQEQIEQEFASTGVQTTQPLDFFRGLGFAEMFAGFGPRERGEAPAIFNPRTRSLFF